MRLLQFLTSRGLRVGVERGGDAVLDLSDLGGDAVLDLSDLGVVEDSVKSLLEGGVDRLAAVQSLVDARGSGCKLLKKDDLQILAPVHNPGKVLCVGMNYRDHCEEQNAPIPSEPVFFSKCLNAICGTKADIKIPQVTNQVDWEVELAFVIGKEGRDIPSESAMDFVAGYTTANDVSARDWQFKPEMLGQWLLGKTMDNFCPIGPVLVTKDEIPDPYNLAMSLRVNGVTKQSSNTSQIIFQIPHIVSYVSRMLTLQPGDVILTGTPPGVGCFRNPKEFLKIGDQVEAEIENIGVITNRFI